MELKIYIVSLCLQLSGALLLLLFCCNKYKIDEQIKFDNEGKYDFGEETIEGNTQDDKKERHYIIASRFAFIEILLGYLSSIFGSINDNVCRCCVFVKVLIVFVIIFISSWVLSGLIAKRIITK